MSIQLMDILKGSSLSSVLSSQEISDIADELKTEVEEYMESQLEEKDDEIQELEEENNDLENQILKLEKNIEDLEYEVETNKPNARDTLQDVLVKEWVDENWETLRRMYLEGRKLDDRVIMSQRDFDIFMGNIENPIDKILSKLLSLGDHKRIILVGKAASGKDFTRTLLSNKGFKYAVSYTTRPAREGEVEGEDYFFKSEEEFIDMMEAGEFYEYVSFNNWHYGTTVKQFFKDDVFIMTPYGVSKIHEDDRKKCFIIYFDIEESVRKERLMLRSDADTVDRRLAADENDFKNFVDFDLRITNHNF
jgi:guanylate kinase